jgi:hypothetical protein
MADDTVKRLLIKLGISTAEWQQAVRDIKKQLDELYASEKVKAEERKKTAAQEVAATKEQQALAQKSLETITQRIAKLREEVAVNAEVTGKESLKLAQEQEALAIKQANYRMLLAEGQISLETFRTLEKQLATERARLVVNQEIIRAATTGSIRRVPTDVSAGAAVAGAKETQTAAQMQARVQAAVVQASPTAITAEQLNQERMVVAELRAQLGLREQILKNIAMEGGVGKEDVTIVTRKMAEERSYLSTLEKEVGIHEQIYRKQQQEVITKQQQERSAAALPSATGVAALQAGTTQAVAQATALSRLTKEQIADREREIAVEMQKLSVQQASLKVLAQQEGVRQADVAAVAKSIIEEKTRLSLQQQQLKVAATQAGEGFFTKMQAAMGNAMKQLTGGGLFGQIAGGAFTGFVGAEIFTGLIEQVHKLGEALVEASGPAQTLRKNFEALSEKRGADPTEFLEKLRASTRGLMSDAQIFGVATNFMRSNMHVTNDQILQLISNTLNLARASGKSVPEAMNALERASASGRVQMLAYATGLTTTDLKLQNIPRSVSGSARATMEFNAILAAEEAALRKVNVPATTLPELMQQGRVAMTNFIDGMAEGITGTTGFDKAISSLSTQLSGFMPKLIQMGKTIGTDVADAAKFVTQHFEAIKLALEGLMALKVLDWGIGVLGIFKGWGTEIDGLIPKLVTVAEKLGLIKTAGGAAEGLGAALGGAVGKKAIGAGEQALEGAGETAVGGAAANIFTGAATASLGTIILAALGTVAAIELIMYIVGRMFPTIGSRLQQMDAEDKAVFGGGTKPYEMLTAEEYKKYKATGGEQVQPYLDTLSHPFGQAAATTEKDSEAPAFEQPNMEVQRQLAQLELKIQEDKLKQKYDNLKQELDLESQLYKFNYELGNTTLDQYLLQQKTMREKQHALVIEQANAEADAQIARYKKESAMQVNAISGQQIALTAQKSAPGVTKDQSDSINRQISDLEAQKKPMIDPAVLAQHEVEAHEQANAKIVADEGAMLKEELSNLQQNLMDRRAAYNEYQQEIIKIAKDSAAKETALLEQRFKDGLVGADSYLAQRQTLLTQEYNAVQAELLQELNDSEQSEQKKAAIRVKMINEAIDFQGKYTKLTQDQESIRAQAVDAQYKRQHDLLVAQEQAATVRVSTGVPGSRGEQVAIQEQIIGLNDRQLAILNEELDSQTKGSKEWFNTLTTIEKITNEQEKMKAQLFDMTDALGPLSKLFGAIVQDIGVSKDGLGGWLKQMTGVLASLSKFNKDVFVAGGAQQFYGGMFSDIGTLFGKKPKPPTEAQQKRQAATVEAAKTPEQRAYDAAQKDSANIIQQATDIVKTSLGNAGDALGTFKGTITDSVTSLRSMADEAKAAAQAFRDAINQLGLGGTKPPAITPPATSAAGLTSSVTLPEIPDTSSLGIAPTPEGAMGLGPTLEGAMGNSAAALTAMNDAALKATGGLQQMTNATGTGTGTGGGGSSNSWSSQFGKTMGDLTKVVGGLGGLIKGVTGGQTTGGGAMGGLMSGMGFGAQFGPMGAAIGAAGGAIVGAMFGQKNEQIQEMATEFKNRMKGIEDGLNAGTISMGNAIQQLQQERTQVAQELSGGKKKEKAQLQPIIDALNTEIQNLQLQQKKTLDNLHEQVSILSEPSQFQPMLNSLDQIIQKYQQFASAAAGNAAEVANANNYLTLSLQEYARTLTDQVHSANEQAVQDGIQLIDLQQQRLDMQNQYLEQEYNILSQGVESRQMTTAQTKGAQIEALNAQYSLQSQQMDEEIALAQYKVSAESKIFNLATDRIALEAQLLALKEQDADKSLQNVEALQQVLAGITTAMAGGTLPAGLLSAIGPVNIQQIEQLLGLTPVTPPGNTSAETNVGGTGGYTYTPTTPYQGPTAPPANSTQGGYQPATPAFQKGGLVAQTGLALLHTKEMVLPEKISVAVQQMAAKTVAGASTPVSVDTSGNTLKIHQQIMDLASTRVGLEGDLISRQQSQTMLDMQRISMLSDLLDKMGSVGTNSSVQSLEGAFAKVYELRGRYGSGSFRRESL